MYVTPMKNNRVEIHGVVIKKMSFSKCASNIQNSDLYFNTVCVYESQNQPSALTLGPLGLEARVQIPITVIRGFLSWIPLYPLVGLSRWSDIKNIAEN